MVMGAEAIDMRNWLISFGCSSEELRFIVVDLDGCMANPPPRAAYCKINGTSPSVSG